MDVRSLNIDQVRAGLESKQFSAIEITTSALEFAQAENSKTNAYLHFCPERALASAAKIDELVAKGEPLPAAARPP